ncbi:Protein of uncharacterised function (DUF1602) [Mycobacterium tuberculosis]|nr:Protein of uncharacterised function (DUF1602) [Mycobacterium tuberculosis]
MGPRRPESPNAWRRNVWVRSLLGFWKICCALPCSTITPFSVKYTTSLISSAKRISWVTSTQVMPSSVSSRITVSTSPTVSGSRAEVTSSNRISSGRMAKARAMATRCCWPPESWPGYASALCSMRTLASSARASFSASARLRPSTLRGAITRFSNTDKCGNKLYCWNTKPTRLRSSMRWAS